MVPLILGNPHLVQKLAKEAPEIEEALGVQRLMKSQFLKVMGPLLRILSPKPIIVVRILGFSFFFWEGVGGMMRPGFKKCPCP